MDGRLQCCVQGSSLTDIDGGVAVVDTVQLCAMQVCALKSTRWRPPLAVSSVTLSCRTAKRASTMMFAQQSHCFCKSPPLRPISSIRAPTTRAADRLTNISAVSHMLAQDLELCPCSQMPSHQSPGRCAHECMPMSPSSGLRFVVNALTQTHAEQSRAVQQLRLR